MSLRTYLFTNAYLAGLLTIGHFLWRYYELWRYAETATRCLSCWWFW